MRKDVSREQSLKVIAKFAQNFPFENLSSDDAQEFIKNPKKYCNLFASTITGRKVLSKRNPQHLELKLFFQIPKMSFKPNTFFVNGENDSGITFWLSKNIKNIFLPLLSKNIKFNGIELEKFKLLKNLNDFDIQKEIGNQVQTPDVIAAEIKYLVYQQPKGEKNGNLDVPYISHIFYFEYLGRVWYVELIWDADNEGWYLYCNEANADEWDAGSVVFLPATDES